MPSSNCLVSTLGRIINPSTAPRMISTGIGCPRPRTSVGLAIKRGTHTASTSAPGPASGFRSFTLPQPIHVPGRDLTCWADTYSRDLSSAPRLIQHKNEAKAFYAFLSQVYDYIVNPGHWTVDMRTEALVPACLDSRDLKVVDVGGGTGFCTQGIVQSVDPTNVTLLDQSPHQLDKARVKPDLQGVTILEGDAEDLPFTTDTFDRYVSAGSIEYWPEPQRGICEAYRVIKPGGLACMIGPVHPTFWLSRAMADTWMLFPTEEEYVMWFEAAGFDDVKLTRIGPSWYRGVRRHGLIMGCSVTGVKRRSGESPLVLPPKSEQSETLNTNPISFLLRLVLGSAAGFYYFILPVYMWLKNLVWPKTGPLADKF